MDLEPYHLDVSVSPFSGPRESPDSIAGIQKTLTRIMERERNDKGVNRGNLPCRLDVDFEVDNPFPIGCEHFEIDLKSAETSRVVRYGHCQPGGAELRLYCDGALMAEGEFESWSRRSGATYSKRHEDQWFIFG